MSSAPFAFGLFARIGSSKARPTWKACGQSLPALSACVLLRAGVASARGRVQPMRPDPKCEKTNSWLRPRPKCGKRETGTWHARTKLQNNR